MEVPNSGIGIDVGLPVTSGPAGFSLDPSLSAHLDSNRFFEDLNFNGELLQGFPSDQPIDFLSPPSRGVALFDSPVPDYEFPQGQAPVDLWSPQERLLVSPQDIETWFCENYASKRSDLPTNHMSEQNGGIWCRLCSPEYTYWAPDMYRQHKEETHGIDFKTGLIYWAPMEIRAIEGGVGLGYEGYCATCLKRIPLDMTKPDFNWFYHASKVGPVSQVISHC